MNAIKTYYEAPSEYIFNDIKECSKRIWQEYEYEQDNIDRINKIDNIKDNYMFIVGMFDENNREKLIDMVRHETADRILEAIDSVR